MLVIGPDQDIPAPDVGTDAQIMAWIMDTYTMIQGQHACPAWSPGKPLHVGGSAGRREATGRGLIYVLCKAVRRRGTRPRAARRVVVQGFGNVG